MDYDKEINSQYPELDKEVKSTDKPAKNKTEHTPAYVLPILVTLLIMGLYLAYQGVNQNSQILKTNSLYAERGYILDKLNHLESQMEKSASRIQLLAILHNENFASVRKATGNNNLIFINKDWTIDQMPSHLSLTPADIARIKQTHLKSFKEIR